MSEDWMADANEAVERALDADDPTTNRNWRHKVVGNSTANVVAMASRTRRSVAMKMPMSEYVILSELAAQRGLLPVDLVRQCVFTHLVEDCDVPAQRLDWMGRAGLLP